LSVEHGIFPELMKTSKTVPVYKRSGSPLEMTNYRPISLINAFSKIFEKIISHQLINFLIKSDFFYDKQFGFLPGRSTNQAVLQIINFISSAWNDNKIVGGIFLDIQKAFDSINHKILFDKLENAGIRGIALDWFKSYMQNRKQRVKVGQFLSNNIRNIDLGVLQGSILGVILFLIYINDIFQASSLFSILFADDISSLGAKNNFEELEVYLNDELKKISVWYRANLLSVHPMKSKVVIFRPHFSQIPVNFNIVIDNNDSETNSPDLINNVQIVSLSNQDSKNRSVRVLGVFLDEFLKLDDHIYHIRSKILHSLFKLNRAKCLLSKKSLTLLYYAHVHSHLNYCSVILSLTTKKNLDSLFILQKRAIRIIYKAKYRDHTNPLFYESKILRLNDIIKFNQIVFIYDQINKNLPPSFNDTWNKHCRAVDYNLRNKEDYYIPMLKYRKLSKHPLYDIPRQWNNFDLNFKHCLDRLKFTKLLKYHYVHLLDINRSPDCICELCIPPFIRNKKK